MIPDRLEKIMDRVKYYFKCEQAGCGCIHSESFLQYTGDGLHDQHIDSKGQRRQFDNAISRTCPECGGQEFKYLGREYELYPPKAAETKESIQAQKERAARIEAARAKLPDIGLLREADRVAAILRSEFGDKPFFKERLERHWQTARKLYMRGVFTSETLEDFIDRFDYPYLRQRIEWPADKEQAGPIWISPEAEDQEE